MSNLNDYTTENRRNDFHFFVEHYQEFYHKYGHKYIAIKNKKILGVFDSVTDTLNTLKSQYKAGTYSIQECDGTEYAYRADIMRLKIKGYER